MPHWQPACPGLPRPASWPPLCREQGGGMLPGSSSPRACARGGLHVFLQFAGCSSDTVSAAPTLAPETLVKWSRSGGAPCGPLHVRGELGLGQEGQSTREPCGRGREERRSPGTACPPAAGMQPSGPENSTILPVCAQHVPSGVCLSPPPAMSQLKGAPGPLGSMGAPHPRWSLERGLSTLQRG